MKDRHRSGQNDYLVLSHSDIIFHQKQNLIMPPSPDTLYTQLSQNLRASDEFSFKLLGLVPLSTLLAFIGILLKEDLHWSPVFYGLGLLGAILIWGIFRWELRNIQRCLWYSEMLDKMEQVADSTIPAFKIYKKPQFLGLPMGKTESEKVIYTVLIIAWLAFPLLVKCLNVENTAINWNSGDVIYDTFAAVILLSTLISCFSKLKIQSTDA